MRLPRVLTLLLQILLTGQAALAATDLSPSGALIAGADLHLDTTGDLITSGTVAGRQIVSLSAENLVNLRWLSTRVGVPVNHQSWVK
ncbi:MAG: hypothetical protein LBE33_01720 [Zoogloeaceae bacterium]|nr:hypothetical protein [Zoogloeaceae bacterium]